MADDGPRILRPVPRRPFELNLTNASPSPSDKDADDSPPSGPSPESSFSSPKFLSTAGGQDSGASLSRPQSFLNLTSSTLMGIYSGAASGGYRVFSDETELNTPWGTGARTPIKRPSVDEATFRLMNERAHLPRRGSSFAIERNHTQPLTAAGAFSLASRGMLLYVLGLGYGALVSRLHNVQHQHTPKRIDESIMNPSGDWKHMTFWGFAGVALGALLPWLDQVWEDTFGVSRYGALDDDDLVSEDDSSPGTDWALVMRAIGAFVGIVFAIRKLAWDSTLQISITLALVNPLLWWLIDRSTPGFVLSAGVGLTGSIFLLGVNSDMMPSPSGFPVKNLSSIQHGDRTLALGGLASSETVESGVWMLSVLFCSCLCFGNIGRRLAWGRSAVAKGRWGGIR